MVLYSIFLLFDFFAYIYPTIHIRFYRYSSILKESFNISIDDFVNQRVENIYKTQIFIGNPPQIIPGFLNTNENEFYITNDNCLEKNNYDKTNSTTFVYGKNNKTFLESLYFYTSFYSTNYYKEIENYTISINSNIDLPLCFKLGTQLLSNTDENNIINVLHRKKYIKSYYYYFKFYSDDELYLIFDKFVNDKEIINYKFINPLSEYYKYQLSQKWGLKFEYIFLNNNKLNIMKETTAEFDINLGCIIGTFYFKYSLDKYLKENDILIQPKIYKKNYYIYFFDKNMKGIEKLKNIKLTFYHKELNYNFILNYNDLFLIKDNGYFLLIIFDWEIKDRWKLGSIFLRKYNFLYNHDSKKIGFQVPNIPSNDITDNDETENNNTTIKEDNKINDDSKRNENDNKYKKIIIYFIIIIIFVVLFVLIFGILIGKKLYEKRKIKVNELLELYDYTSNSNKS